MKQLLVLGIATLVLSSSFVVDAQPAFSMAPTKSASAAVDTNRPSAVKVGPHVEITLPPTVRASKHISCGNNRVIRILEQPGASNRHRAELALVNEANTKGKSLVLSGAPRGADGVITVQSVSIEPEASEPADLCSLPFAKEKLAKCK
jgi:hypothetical protein